MRLPDEDPDDLFAATRMPLGEHIEELRRHLLRALAGLVVGAVIGFYVSEPVLKFIDAPVSAALEQFYQRRAEELRKKLKAGDPAVTRANEPAEVSFSFRREELARALGIPQREGPEWVALTVRVRPLEVLLPLDRAERAVLRPPGVTALSATETFIVYFKVSLYCGVVLASPWIFYQLWTFVAAGLYPHERRQVRIYLPLSVGLFLGGVCLCEFVVIPLGIEYLLSYNEWLVVEPNIRLSEWLGFALLMPLVFGAAFQTPLVMVFLNRVGVLSVDAYRRHRRLALFLLTVLAAVLTVTPDAVNMLALAVPLWGLYELGILLCRLAPRPAPEPEREDEELVEV